MFLTQKINIEYKDLCEIETHDFLLKTLAVFFLDLS